MSRLSSRPAVFLAVALATLAMFGVLALPRTAQKAEANPLTGIASVAAGELHTCAITTSGGVKCWGDNVAGQLGNGLTTDSPVPVDVSGLSAGVSALAMGTAHSCALTTGGAVKCWGDMGPAGVATTPVVVTGLDSGVTDIAANSSYTCAVASGGVKCFGQGGYVFSATPVVVPGLASGITSVAAGLDHICALTTTGAVKCRGDNEFGELGNGTMVDSATPVDVAGLGATIAAVEVGTDYSCARTAAGAVKCWGFGYGLNPAVVSSLGSGVAAISAKLTHSCALMSTGAVTCWGDNGSGQLGDGMDCGLACATPVAVAGITSGATGVSAGGYHSCATVAGVAKCWGLNVLGGLGDGTTTSRTTPVSVVSAAKPTPTDTPCPGACPTPTPTATPGTPTNPQFHIRIDANGDSVAECSTAQRDAKCTLASNAQFDVTVVLQSSGDASGYEAYDAILRYSGVVTKRAADLTLWPDCVLPATNFDAPGFAAMSCLHGAGAPSSTFSGPIAAAAFTCGTSTGAVELLHGPGNTDIVVPPGVPRYEAPSGQETLTINCVPPTPTPTPTRTPTPADVGGISRDPNASGSSASARTRGDGFVWPWLLVPQMALGLGAAVWYARRRPVR